MRIEEERRRQDTSEGYFELTNGISNVSFAITDKTNVVQDSGSKSNPDVKTEIKNYIQKSGTTSQLTHQNVSGSHIFSSSFENNFQSDPALFKPSNLSFWLTESVMNDYTTIKYTCPSDTTK